MIIQQFLPLWLCAALLCFPCADCAAVVSNCTFPIVPWNIATNPQFPIRALLYRDDANLSGVTQGAVVLFSGTIAHDYRITEDFAAALHKFQGLPHILAVLVVDASSTPGFCAFGIPAPSSPLPIWILGSQASPLLKMQGPQELVVLELNVNEWLQLDAPYYFWLWSLLVGHCLCLLGAMVTLWVLWSGGRWVNIASLCLVLEWIGSVVRISAIVIEWYLMLPNSRFLTSLTMPFFLGSSGLLVFFWLDITSGSLYDGKFLDKMKLPAITFFFVLFSMEIILDILNYLSNIPNFFFMIFYCILCLLLGSLYLLVAYKISNLPLKPSKSARLKMINIKATLCAALFFLFVVLIVLLASPVASGSVVAYRSLIYLVYLDLIVISLLQISIFFQTNVRKTGSSGTKTPRSSKSFAKPVDT